MEHSKVIEMHSNMHENESFPMQREFKLGTTSFTPQSHYSPSCVALINGNESPHLKCNEIDPHGHLSSNLSWADHSTSDANELMGQGAWVRPPDPNGMEVDEVLDVGDNSVEHHAGLEDHLSPQMFRSGLSDMGFKSPPCTWEARDVKERLDIGVCNHYWWHVFPDSFILRLPQLKLDHKPLLLRLHGDSHYCQVPRSFRFMASWLTNEGFNSVVQWAKRNTDDWLIASNNFRENAIAWNTNMYDKIYTKPLRT
ncbi:unnamed protein product [Lupinus luteus]|uniref:Uncharacterized protein n=1 Tax=Lupinus luteus TaxID=3873 RepID=A0AAV1Y0Z7_LUPLU